MEIDDPESGRIGKPVGVLRGWLAAHDVEIPEKFSFRLNGVTLPHRVVARSDVEEAMPEDTIVGFEIRYDLASYLPYIEDNRLVIHMRLPGYDPFLLRLKIEEGAMALCLADAGEV